MTTWFLRSADRPERPERCEIGDGIGNAGGAGNVFGRRAGRYERSVKKAGECPLFVLFPLLVGTAGTEVPPRTGSYVVKPSARGRSER